MVTVVAGLPGAGKSTYVRDHMGKGDIVFDADEIHHAITYRDAHSHRNNAEAAFINDIMFDLVRDHETFGNDLWLIRAIPDADMMRKVTRDGWACLLIDTEASTCEARRHSDSSMLYALRDWKTSNVGRYVTVLDNEERW
jgi:predicted ABC-type ATPase